MLKHLRHAKKVRSPAKSILTILNTLNPLSYRQSSYLKISASIKYMVMLTFFSMVALGVLSYPLLSNVDEEISSGLDNFKSINVSLDFQTEEDLKISQFLVSSTVKNVSSEDYTVVMTSQGIFARSVECQLFSSLCFLSEQEQIVSFQSLFEDPDELAEALTTVFWLMLPYLLVVFFLVVLVKYFIITCLLTLLAFIATRLMFKSIGLLGVFNVATRALTPFIVMDVINIRLGFNLYYIPLIVSIALLVVGVISVNENYMDAVNR